MTDKTINKFPVDRLYLYRKFLKLSIQIYLLILYIYLYYYSLCCFALIIIHISDLLICIIVNAKSSYSLSAPVPSVHS